ncbi:hypothetical protein [Acetobacter oeni]|uniref:Uncharacterized protein n=1 Tax=Acetobacter oeni TaxID=304077 RepID=A0A511XGB0_9PROT|nr:hypothetical protein [Acetobacter oeni]MBB3882108.1 hypothetical protein [Acetobacter oeni]NHO17872.1 hypothetical protein [Acetobacter oeni]GEN61968.1 hypothetical protein AOE01nite_01920 [Acetobacter oeni]
MHRPLAALTAFLIVLACTLTPALLHLPEAASVAAGVVGAALVAVITATTSPAQTDPSRRTDTGSPIADPEVEISSKLRHDLRGIISPAVLCADHLSTHQDETVRIRAEQILAALDRTTDRLKSAKS